MHQPAMTTYLENLPAPHVEAIDVLTAVLSEHDIDNALGRVCQLHLDNYDEFLRRLVSTQATYELQVACCEKAFKLLSPDHTRRAVQFGFPLSQRYVANGALLRPSITKFIITMPFDFDRGLEWFQWMTKVMGCSKKYRAHYLSKPFFPLGTNYAYQPLDSYQ